MTGPDLDPKVRVYPLYWADTGRLVLGVFEAVEVIEAILWLTIIG